ARHSSDGGRTGARRAAGHCQWPGLSQRYAGLLPACLRPAHRRRAVEGQTAGRWPGDADELRLGKDRQAVCGGDGRRARLVRYAPGRFPGGLDAGGGVETTRPAERALFEASVMFAGSAEPDIRPALFYQAEIDAGRSQVGEVAAAVDGEVLVGLVLELLEFLLVAAFDPARRPDVDRLVGALDLVFLLETAGDHVELQHTDRAEDDVVVALGEEHLGGAFLGQLLQTLTQLLGFERVLQAHAAEQLRGEVRDAGETEVLAFGEGIADLDGAVVVQAEDVAGIGFFQVLALAGEEGQCVADGHVLAQAGV